MNIFIILGIFLLVLIFWIISIANKLIAKKNRIQQAYGSLDAYLKERFDLIPNIVTTLKKYMDHEKKTFIEITRLRTEMEIPKTNKEKIEDSNKLNSILSGLVVENHPELKADKQFLNLQFTLQDMEEKISASRRAYNAAVTDYNNGIEQFPGKFIAKVNGFKPESVLETIEKERKNVDIMNIME